MDAAPSLPLDLDRPAITDLVLRRRCCGRGRWRRGGSPFLIASAGTSWRSWRSIYAVRRRASASGASTPASSGASPIANYVWWIGIGNAGHADLVAAAVTRQDWRASINRFAEAMTLFAVVDRRALSDPSSGTADVFLLARALSQHDDGLAAVAQRAGLGLLGDPVLPPVLDPLLVRRPDPRSRRRCAIGRATDRGGRIYGALALGWRGSARHWQRLPTLQITLAALAVPLVCLRPFDRRARLRREPDARLAASRSSRPISSSARCTRASPWWFCSPSPFRAASAFRR